jgi:CRP-like cAMP-binding protein
MQDGYWILKRSSLFDQIPHERLRSIEAQCRFRDFPRGAYVYAPVDQADAALFLLEGRIKLITLSPDGKQAILGVIDKGEMFGELAVLAGGTREEFAETMSACRLLLIPAKVLRQLMAEFPTVSMEIVQLFGLRRQRIERRLRSLLFRSGRERLEALLMELAEQYGRQRQEGLVIDHRLTYQELANYVGLTRETVTLLLNELQREGKVSLQRRRIVLLPASGLIAAERLACNRSPVSQDRVATLPVPLASTFQTPSP